MFADPYDVVFGGVAAPMNRMSSGDNRSLYTSDSGNITMEVSHSYGKRTRRMFRFNQTIVAADPLYPATNGRYVASAYMVLDAPIVGFTPTEQVTLVQAVVDTLDQTSGAAITKLVNGQT